MFINTTLQRFTYNNFVKNIFHATVFKYVWLRKKKTDDGVCKWRCVASLESDLLHGLVGILQTMLPRGSLTPRLSKNTECIPYLFLLLTASERTIIFFLTPTHS